MYTAWNCTASLALVFHDFDPDLIVFEALPVVVLEIDSLSNAM